MDINSMRKMVRDGDAAENSQAEVANGGWFRSRKTYAISACSMGITKTIIWSTAEICERLDKLIGQDELRCPHPVTPHKGET